MRLSSRPSRDRLSVWNLSIGGAMIISLEEGLTNLLKSVKIFCFNRYVMSNPSNRKVS